MDTNGDEEFGIRNDEGGGIGSRGDGTEGKQEPTRVGGKGPSFAKATAGRRKSEGRRGGAKSLLRLQTAAT